MGFPPNMFFTTKVLVSNATTDCPVKIKQPLLVFLFPLDAVKRVFIQLAQISFTGFPNLIKTAKVGALLVYLRKVSILTFLM